MVLRLRNTLDNIGVVFHSQLYGLLLVFLAPCGTAVFNPHQCLSQDLETGCLKLAVVKFLGVQIFKGDHNILIF